MRFPILMYHAIGSPPPGTRHTGNYLNADAFAEQLSAFVALGYRAVRLTERKQASGMALSITFDDGYASVHEIAWPLLKKFGFVATTFVVTGMIGRTNLWDSNDAQVPLLDEGQIRELSRQGMEFGSHTASHRAVTKLSSAEVELELSHSRLALSRIISKPVDAFAYPYSKFDGPARALVAGAGYSVAVRGGGGTNSEASDPLALHRIKVDDTVSLDSLLRSMKRPNWLKWLPK